jgi:putative lipoprotein
MKKVLILVSSIFTLFLVGCQEETGVSATVSDEVADVQVSQQSESSVSDTEELVSDLDSIAGSESAAIEQDMASPASEDMDSQLADVVEPGVIAGNITAQEAVTLPENAIVTVTLEDVSLADAPAEVISEQTFVADGIQIPFDFELNFDENKIQANHQYSVRARVEVDGKLKFTTDKIYSVITDENKTEEVNLSLVGV